jgi:hypothetical protein
VVGQGGQELLSCQPRGADHRRSDLLVRHQTSKLPQLRDLST